MKPRWLFAWIGSLAVPALAQAVTPDPADLARYREANHRLIASGDARPRIVFMGDSITDFWKPQDRPGPPGINFVNRGISGQVTGQMLLRFREDVLALKPAKVAILGGTNDIFRGIETETILQNIAAMADLADHQHIRVILCAVPPMGKGPVELAPRIVAANARIKAMAQARHYHFADYHAALVDRSGHLPPEFAPDGVHPNPAGYARMWPVLDAALQN
jgi:lysophospholipase L1-like esterase